MNVLAFIAISLLVLSSALAAVTLPRLIHAALSVAVAFVGVAAFYFWLGAEFVGLVQILVYVGAVAVLIVFTILLTRGDENEETGATNWSGIASALAVFAGLLWTLLRSPSLAQAAPNEGIITVKQIGEVLMTHYVWPLQCVGLILTAALIGALVLVLEEKK